MAGHYREMAVSGGLTVFFCPWTSQAHFKHRATAVPNSIDGIRFDFRTAVARRLKPSRATAV